MEHPSHRWVGIAAALALGYTLILMAIHMYIPHPDLSRRVLQMSYASLVLLSCALMFIVGTYFAPFLLVDGTSATSAICMCHIYWNGAALCYILGIYAIKQVYIERVKILQQYPRIASRSFGSGSQYVSYLHFATCGTCLALVFAASRGECHADVTLHGCQPSLDALHIYVAIFGLAIDLLFFAMFCWRWRQIVNAIKHEITDEKLAELLQSFGIEFVVTVIAFSSVVIDALFNMYTQDYIVRVVFCLDCAVVATCNFAVITESRVFLCKYLCCGGCRICNCCWVALESTKHKENIAKLEMEVQMDCKQTTTSEMQPTAENNVMTETTKSETGEKKKENTTIRVGDKIIIS